MQETLELLALAALSMGECEPNTSFYNFLLCTYGNADQASGTDTFFSLRKDEFARREAAQEALYVHNREMEKCVAARPSCSVGLAFKETLSS